MSLEICRRKSETTELQSSLRRSDRWWSWKSPLRLQSTTTHAHDILADQPLPSLGITISSSSERASIREGLTVRQEKLHCERRWGRECRRPVNRFDENTDCNGWLGMRYDWKYPWRFGEPDESASQTNKMMLERGRADDRQCHEDRNVSETASLNLASSHSCCFPLQILISIHRFSCSRLRYEMQGTGP